MDAGLSIGFRYLHHSQTTSSASLLTLMRPTPIPRHCFLPITSDHPVTTFNGYSQSLFCLNSLENFDVANYTPFSKTFFSLEFSNDTLSLGFVLFYPPISQTLWPNSISQQLLLVAYGSFLEPIPHSSCKQFQYVFYQNFIKVDNLSHRQNNELRPLPHTIHKNYLKIDQRPQCNSKTEQNIGVNLCDFGFSE